MKLKLILSFSLLFLLVTFAYAQTLEFSQVINVGNTYSRPNSTTNIFDSVTVVIPAGKVWKVESARMNYSYLSSGVRYYSLNGSDYISINGAIIYVASSTNTSFTYPIWYPAGTYTFKARSSISGTSYQVTWLVSAIEFNVVP
ncbi:MAG: hypothetical protein H6581_03765 [Bacteroidia bacterium]|nr:hypothetical protein [Bacteroidia bacterium]